ncbi:MAG: hypothetical protein WCX48_11265, partial [Bacteroidales bacterium]
MADNPFTKLSSELSEVEKKIKKFWEDKIGVQSGNASVTTAQAPFSDAAARNQFGYSLPSEYMDTDKTNQSLYEASIAAKEAKRQQEKIQTQSNKETESFWNTPLSQNKSAEFWTGGISAKSPNEIIESPELQLALLGTMPSGVAGKGALVDDIVNTAFGATMGSKAITDPNLSPQERLMYGAFGVAGVPSGFKIGQSATKAVKETVENAGGLKNLATSESGTLKPDEFLPNTGKNVSKKPVSPTGKSTTETNWQKAQREANDQIEYLENEYTAFPNATEQKINQTIKDISTKYNVPESTLRKQVLGEAGAYKGADRTIPTKEQVTQMVSELTPSEATNIRSKISSLKERVYWLKNGKGAQTRNKKDITTLNKEIKTLESQLAELKSTVPETKATEALPESKMTGFPAARDVKTIENEMYSAEREIQLLT